MPTTAEDAPDRMLGERYRLEAVIGSGGMATVYRAQDEALGRPVAVKLFHSGAVDVGRQEGELAVLASLDHHALVNLFDAGTERDALGRSNRYIVMALVNGVNLRERILTSQISARHIAEIGYDMAEALEYIHSHNVIHRDIKPSNILLVDYGNDAPRARAKLADFGIALAEDIERMSVDGVTTGTAAYLSPEQASGREVTGASDVYSLGLVLLECFTRTVEFPGTMVESAVARLARDPNIPESLPEHWLGLLRVMTARDPAARPSGRDLASALRQVVIAESARHKDADSVFDPDAEPGSQATGPGGQGTGPGGQGTGPGGQVTGLGGQVTGPGGQGVGRPDILDTLPNEALHRVTTLAARLFSAPISIVSVVDHDRTWFRSHYGAEVEQIARSVDLSKTAIPADVPVVVEDGRIDPRTRTSALVTGPLGLRFYVGVPLKRQDGQTIGTLSVLDFVPGTASETEIANLQDLAALVVAQLELRQEGLRNTGELSAPAAPAPGEVSNPATVASAPVTGDSTAAMSASPVDASAGDLV